MSSSAETSTASWQVPPGTGGLAGALERGCMARIEWTQDGTLMSPATFAKRRGVSLQDLRDLVARNELFGVEVAGQAWLPADLLKLEPSTAAVVCRALGDIDPARKLIFLMREHGALGGLTVVDAVEQGRLPKVLFLAEAWEYR